VKRALLGLALVLAAAAGHVGLIFAGVYRRYPIEWWALALLGAGVAVSAWKGGRAGARRVAVLAILAALTFGYFTTIGSRIRRPELGIAPGHRLAAFSVAADDGRTLTWPRPAGPHRATLLVLFRGVW
jgi:drug/metabolite transporter (DMT)-like permease